MYLNVRFVKEVAVSASPFLVSTPFTLFDLNRFEETEEKALWQPPGYVFGIVWSYLYISLFVFNLLIFQDPLISQRIKSIVMRDTLIESTLQGIWLYLFRFKDNIQGRISSYNKSLVAMSGLVLMSFYRLFFIFKNVGLLKYMKYYLLYAIWINFANILNWQLVLGYKKKKSV
tara:strand:+ start:1614 stop:2132 length:519 start_codon:yes stop_codon:yes gene_type:complete